MRREPGVGHVPPATEGLHCGPETTRDDQDKIKHKTKFNIQILNGSENCTSTENCTRVREHKIVLEYEYYNFASLIL